MKNKSLKLVLVIAIVFTVYSIAFAEQSPQMPFAGSAIPQFVQPLPTLSLAPTGTGMTTVFGNQPLTLRMCEFKANVLPAGTVAGYTGTWVWGYLADPTGTSTCVDLINLYKSPNGALDTYIGPVIINQRGTPTEVTYVNDLGNASTTNLLAYKYATDQTLHWADPLFYGPAANMCMMSGIPAFGSACAQNYDGPIPAVAHLHGGEVPPEIDGSPDSWWTSDGLHFGNKYYSFGGAAANAAVYKYPNMQEASPIWFHDHTLGATRLNVYMGLAGAYLITDPNLTLPTGLSQYGPLNGGASGNDPELIVPVVLQDRMFDTNGQLFFPADSAGGILSALNPEHPYWVPEFVGDAIVVNGKAWPYTNVEPKRYVFWFLNGSNARTYEMFLINQATGKNGPPIYVIATDGGYLDKPAMINPALGQKLLMQPGERYLVMIDFSGLQGTSLVLRNVGRTPYAKGPPPQGSSLGRILQFRVTACPAAGCPADPSYNPAGGTLLRSGSQKIVRLVNPATGTLTVPVAKTRQLTLNEIMGMPITAVDPVTGLLTAYPGGPLEILVNNTKWAGSDRPDFVPLLNSDGTTTYFSEMPREGDTEMWEIVNMTADAHPIHLHLVQFQIINRQKFNANKYSGVYSAAFGTGPEPLPAGCIAGMFCPAYGPPLNINPSTASGGKYGGNPDITPWLQGAIAPPASNEAGWKDTVVTYPGQVTRIAVRWAPTDIPTSSPSSALYFPFDPNAGSLFNYVWHCHIVDHEDNEMMRPDVVELNPLAPAPPARPLVKGISY